LLLGLYAEGWRPVRETECWWRRSSVLQPETRELDARDCQGDAFHLSGKQARRSSGQPVSLAAGSTWGSLGWRVVGHCAHLHAGTLCPLSMWCPGGAEGYLLGL